MLIEEKCWTVPEVIPVAADGVGDHRAGEPGGELEAFRNYLTLMARRELAPDLAAKVGASDLVQDTFLAARRDMAQFEGSSPAELRSWLKGILQHLLANLRRRYRGTRKRRIDLEVRLGHSVDGASEDRVAALSASATTPSALAMRQEREDALHEALADLPDHYRHVIRWHHQDRQPFEVVAKRLGVSPDAARKLWARALLRLRKALGPGHDPQ